MNPETLRKLCVDWPEPYHAQYDWTFAHVEIMSGQRYVLTTTTQGFAVQALVERANAVPALLAEITAQAARIAELEQQRDHARQWANMLAALEDLAKGGVCGPGLEALRQSMVYAHPLPPFPAPQNVTASDGWKVGEPLP